MPTVRLMTYNIRSMRDDRAALARVISAAAPDVVCVQEAPRFLRWRSTCAALARMSGLVVVGGGRPAAANLVLSTLSVDVVSVSHVLFTKDRGLHQRGTAVAVFRFRGITFAVAGTHLDTRPEPRLRHIAELDAAIAAHVPAGVPVVVAADVNDQPGSPAWSALTRGRTDAFTATDGPIFTSTARRPHQTIDGIFADSRVTVRQVSVISNDDTAAASDHLPVLAEIEFPG
ncbi:MAG TPA: endonuclease/exonuclease/phosphatase family protein [Jatrophihabitantaceae bacterium]|nr:endonuclease/exonuclease/phosphatase family protein [Jatrophihabitantaceae bacterium]